MSSPPLTLDLVFTRIQVGRLDIHSSLGIHRWHTFIGSFDRKSVDFGYHAAGLVFALHTPDLCTSGYKYCTLEGMLGEPICWLKAHDWGWV